MEGIHHRARGAAAPSNAGEPAASVVADAPEDDGGKGHHDQRDARLATGIELGHRRAAAKAAAGWAAHAHEHLARSVREALGLSPPNQTNKRSFGRGTHWLTRVVFVRGLALIYLVAFKVSNDQNAALIGTDGLTPFDEHLRRVSEYHGGAWRAFGRVPTLLLLMPRTDASLLLLSRAGLALSACVLALGAANKLMLAALWFLYMSIVNAGQVWFGFGWEMLLLEVGFLSIFTSPTLRVGQFTPQSPLPRVVRWMYRWLLYRVIMGAGLIKIRGDEVRPELQSSAAPRAGRWWGGGADPTAPRAFRPDAPPEPNSAGATSRA